MFSLCYLPTAGRLTITMIKARNLKAMDITGASGKEKLLLSKTTGLTGNLNENECPPTPFPSLS